MSEEPLVKIIHECDIHYAIEKANGYGGTELTMTSKTLKASVVVPASVAIKLAEDLADEIFNESNNPCLSYDCQNAECKGWINTLRALKEEYKDLQSKEPDYEVELESDDLNDLINWALEYAKQKGLLNDYAYIASYALSEVDDAILEELLKAGYTPEEIFEAFSNYIDEDSLLTEFCYLKDYEKVEEFLKEMDYECEDF